MNKQQLSAGAHNTTRMMERLEMLEESNRKFRSLTEIKRIETELFANIHTMSDSSYRELKHKYATFVL